MNGLLVVMKDDTPRLSVYVHLMDSGNRRQRTLQRVLTVSLTLEFAEFQSRPPGNRMGDLKPMQCVSPHAL